MLAAGLFALGAPACFLFDSLSGYADGAPAAPADASDASDAVAPDAGDEGGACCADGAADAPAESSSPPRFVQAKATSAGDASTTDFVLDLAVVAGDTLLVGIDFQGDATVVSVTDTQSDAFTTNTSVADAAGLHSVLVSAIRAAGGFARIAVQLDRPVAAIDVYGHEYADVSSIGVALGASGTAARLDGMESPVITTTVPNELLFGYGVTGTAAAGTGFAARSTFSDNITEDRLLLVPGPYRATATMTQGSSWTMIAATLKPR